MFATDRDLLVLEPRLLHEVAWLGQRVHSSESVVIDGGGSGVTDPSGPFESPGLGVGSVLLLDDLAAEVVEVMGPTQVTISLIRADREGAIIPVATLGATARLDAFTFAPQIEMVHRQLLRGLGLADGTTQPGAPAEDRVMNAGVVGEMEALGALHLIYTAAVPLARDAGVIGAKSARYLERFRESRLGIGAELDLDGDGVADATRRVGAFQLVRR